MLIDNSLPMVSVIIPTYNRSAFLIDAIESVFAQDYQPIEIIVMDDGSTDDTAVVLEPYKGRISYFYQHNQGVSVARNKGIENSKGTLIAFLDSDDVWLPDKLAKQVRFLAEHPEIGAVSSHAVYIDQAGKMIRDDPLYPGQSEGLIGFEQNLLRSPLAINTLLIRRDCLPSKPVFPPGVRFGEDWDMCLHLGRKSKIWFLTEKLVGVRNHEGQVSTSFPAQEQVDQKLHNRLGVIERYYIYYPDQECDGLKPKAEAIEFARAAIPSYCNTEYDIGRTYLSEAIRLDPETWNGGKPLYEAIVGAISMIQQKKGIKSGEVILESIFTHLPSTLMSNKNFKKKVYSGVSINQAFASYRMGDYQKVTLLVLRGIVNNSAWSVNRGVWSIFIKSGLKSLQ